MRADWLLPDDKKLEVTLKILNTEKNLIVSSISADIFSSESFIVKNSIFFISIGISTASRKLGQSNLTWADKNVRFHPIGPTYHGHWIDTIGTSGWVPSKPQHTFDIYGCTDRVRIFVGPCIALSSREKYYTWTHSVFNIASDTFRFTQYVAGSVGRSRISENLFQKWVSVFLDYTKN